MEIKELRNIVANYNPIDNIQNNGDDDRYVSLLAVEQILKNKQNELYRKIEQFQQHISKVLKKECRIEFMNARPTCIRAFQYGIDNICLIFCESLLSNENSKIILDSDYGEYITYYKNGKWTREDKKSYKVYNEKIQKDPVVAEFMNYYFSWCKNFYDRNSLETNIGLCLDIFQNGLDGLNIVLSDRDEIRVDSYKNRFNFSRFLYEIEKEYFGKKHGGLGPRYNFCYHHDVMNDQRDIDYGNDECKSFLNESQIANIYSTIKVDVSSFSKELQEEMRKYESYYQVGLHEQADKEKNELIRIQTERVFEAYRELKKVAELLVNLKTEVNLEKIKLEDIELLFFKNSGKQNERGYIEIDDMFKNNMFLRLLDLKDIDLTNVDIRGMDFSGTNIHIDPQTIYNKDMTNVNASGVKFSPFSDSFNGVILDRAIIDDWEAMINLDNVKSYNNQTQIPEIDKRESRRI